MYITKQYEQTAVFDPTNPGQVIREAYVPGGYQSFYFNRVPNQSSLKGLRGTFWDGLPSWAQILIVGAVSTGAGYFAMAKWGDSVVKPGLRKLGINLAGSYSRRR